MVSEAGKARDFSDIFIRLIIYASWDLLSFAQDMYGFASCSGSSIQLLNRNSSIGLVTAISATISHTTQHRDVDPFSGQ